MVFVRKYLLDNNHQCLSRPSKLTLSWGFSAVGKAGTRLDKVVRPCNGIRRQQGLPVSPDRVIFTLLPRVHNKWTTISITGKVLERCFNWEVKRINGDHVVLCCGKTVIIPLPGLEPGSLGWEPSILTN